MTTETLTESRRRIVQLNSPRGDTESNILQWQFAMTYALKARKLWYLIEGTVKKENGIPVGEEVRLADSDSLISCILENVHEENINLIMNLSNPKAMWEELQSSHLLNSSGTRYYYLRSLMGLPVPDEDGIKDHLLLIDNIGTSLSKICVDGRITIEDIKVAALTSSLPSSFNSVTSHFERQSEVTYKSVADAVRGAVVNNKNRPGQSSISSTANSVKPTNVSTNKGGKTGRGERRENGQICDHCKSPNHVIERCLKKQNEDLKNTIESLAKKVDAIGKAKMAQEDDSDYSDSMARSATQLTANRTTGFAWNLDSACSNTIVPSTIAITDQKSSSLTLQTADNSLIKASSSGLVHLPNKA